MAQRTKYTEEYKLEAVDYYRKSDGKTIKQCASELGLNAKTLNEWILRVEREGKVATGKPDLEKQLDAANRRIADLEGQVAFLKKAGATRSRVTRYRAHSVRAPIPSGWR